MSSGRIKIQILGGGRLPGAKLRALQTGDLLQASRMRAGRGLCELPQTRQRDVCTPDTLRCSPASQRGKGRASEELDGRIVFTARLPSLHIRQLREGGTIMPPVAQGKGRSRVCSQPGQGPGRGHKTHRTSCPQGPPPHPPACPPAQMSHPELSQNLIPLPPSSQPSGGSWQLPSSPLM